MPDIPKPTHGELSITRLSNEEDHPARITLRSDRKRVIEIRASLESFSAALLGLTDRPCIFWQPAVTTVDPAGADDRTALYVVATMIRDAVNRYRDSGLQSDADELDRLTGLFNLPPVRLFEKVCEEVDREKKGKTS